jgi:hypothetical protein
MDFDGATPRRNGQCFTDWWAKTICKVERQFPHHSYCMAVMETSQHMYVFYGAYSSVSEVLQQFRDEYMLWCLTGARKLLALGLDGVGTLV